MDLTPITGVPMDGRDIKVITSEIKMLQSQAQSMMLSYGIEIGRRLVEAKSLLKHGEWGGWLETEVSFSQSTANRFMKIYQEYGAEQNSLFGEAKSSTLTNLGISQALKLLAVPEEEREEFVKNNDVENLSARELDKLIRERDEALKAKAEAEADAEKVRAGNRELNAKLQERAGLEKTVGDLRTAVAEAEKKTADLEKKLKKAKDTAAKKEQALAELKANPQIPQEALDKVAEEAATEAERKHAAAEVQLKAELEKAVAERDELQKKLKTADAGVTEFKTYFTSVQETFNKLSGALIKVRNTDAETADKLAGAVRALLAKLQEQI